MCVKDIGLQGNHTQALCSDFNVVSNVTIFEKTMIPILQLETPRLLLRQWRETDLWDFAQMCRDPDVMLYSPSKLSGLECAELIGRIRVHFDKYGFGAWALERKDTGQFIGLTGLSNVSFKSHFTPAVEIGWRLSKPHWGLGYAREAALTVLRCGFDQLMLSEIVAFTNQANRPSLKVMHSIGMQHDSVGNFEHPNIHVNNPLRQHVLYRITRAQWMVIKDKI